MKILQERPAELDQRGFLPNARGNPWFQCSQVCKQVLPIKNLVGISVQPFMKRKLPDECQGLLFWNWSFSLLKVQLGQLNLWSSNTLLINQAHPSLGLVSGGPRWLSHESSKVHLAACLLCTGMLQLSASEIDITDITMHTKKRGTWIVITYAS